MKKLILPLLFIGLMFAQSSLGRIDGQVKMQNDLIDALDSPYTNALEVIDYAHHEIHSGRHYEVAGSFSLGSGDTSMIVFDVGDTTRWSHMVWAFDVLAATTIDVIEGGAFVRSPDAVTVINNNRNSSNVTVMDTVFVVHNDSTLATRYGTTLFTHDLGAGQQTGAALGRDSELILAQDSTYIFFITSNAASNKVDYEFQWYEHINQ